MTSHVNLVTNVDLQEYGSSYRLRCSTEFSRCHYIQAGLAAGFLQVLSEPVVVRRPEVAMDAGTVAGTSHMHFSIYSPEIQRGAILPQQAARSHLFLAVVEQAGTMQVGQSELMHVQFVDVHHVRCTQCFLRQALTLTDVAVELMLG